MKFFTWLLVCRSVPIFLVSSVKGTEAISVDEAWGGDNWRESRGVAFLYWENCCSSQGHGTAQVGCGGDNTWFVIDDADDEHMEEDHEIEKADCRLKNEDEDAVTRTSRKKNGKPGRFVSKPDSLWVQCRWWE